MSESTNRTFRNILRDVRWAKEHPGYVNLPTFMKNTLSSIEFQARGEVTVYSVYTIPNPEHEFVLSVTPKVLRTYSDKKSAIEGVKEQREAWLSDYEEGYEPWLYVIKEEVKDA